MSNKISLISLAKDGSDIASFAQDRIAGIVAKLYPKVGTFESFADAKALLKGLSASFSHAKIVVVSAETSRYIYLKNLLFQALNLETEASDTIITTIAEHSPDESDEATISHALVPKNATVFLSEDGLFSGFAVKSGKQHLIVLPPDFDRAGNIFEIGFTEYLKTAISLNKTPVDAAEEENVVTSLLAKLISQDVCFAVAANKTSAFIEKKLSTTDVWENSFKFADCDEEKKDLTQKEFIAGLAHQAQEKTGCAAGIAISNVFTSEKEDGRMFILVTVADKLRARVAKVYAEPGEDARQLVNAAVETLFVMADDYVDIGGFTGFPISQDDSDIPEEEKQNRSRLAVKLFISGLIVAIICICLVLFGGRLVSAVKEYGGKGFDTSQTQTQEPTVLAISDESSCETAIEGDEYDPKYLLSLLAEAFSYAASEESSTTQTDSPSSAPAQNITKSKTTNQGTIKTSVGTSKTPTEKQTAAVIKKTTTPATTKTTTAVITQATTAVTIQTTATTPISPEEYVGTFTFNVKGFGHGVGMSQEGAKSYARQGWSYEKILLHYYTPGVTLLDDPNKPENVSYGGNSIELIEYLARTVAREIGTGSPMEALKAQTVAAYTFAKSYGFNVSRGKHAYSTAFNMDPNSNVMKAVNEVAGQYLSYASKAISAFYFASAAGQTVSSASVWGGTVPYLKGGITSPESVSTSSRAYTANAFKALVDNYNLTCGATKPITLQDNPADWIKIIRTGNAGYIDTIRVGDREMRGYSFRQDLLKLGIRSHSFTLSYTPA